MEFLQDEVTLQSNDSARSCDTSRRCHPTCDVLRREFLVQYARPIWLRRIRFLQSTEQSVHRFRLMSKDLSDVVPGFAK